MRAIEIDVGIEVGVGWVCMEERKAFFRNVLYRWRFDLQRSLGGEESDGGKLKDKEKIGGEKAVLQVREKEWTILV